MDYVPGMALLDAFPLGHKRGGTTSVIVQVPGMFSWARFSGGRAFG